MIRDREPESGSLVASCGPARRRLCVRLCLVGVALVASSACVPDVVRHNETGNDQFADQNYAAAADEYRQAQVADPDLAQPYYNAANAYNRAGQIEPVEAQTEQALRTADAALAGRSWYNLGNAYFDEERWSPAIGAYQEALRLDPDDVDAKHNLELALQKLEEDEEEEQDPQQSQPSAGGESQEEEDEEPGLTSEDQSDLPGGGEGGTEEGLDVAGSELEEAGEMTREQATRLLETVLAESETLQERLQQYRQFPGSEPEQDW